MELFWPKNKSAQSLETVGVSLGGNDQRHIGVLFKDENVVYFLHLEWHNSLKCEQPMQDHVWANANLDETTGKTVAIFCSWIRDKRNTVPYSFILPSGKAFDSQGNYIREAPGSGLTCATFALSVFEDFGIELIKKDDWPKRADDMLFFEKVVQLLKSSRAPLEHIQKNEEAIQTAIRFRPEEVFVATILDDKPNCYTSIAKPATEALQFLDSSINGVT